MTVAANPAAANSAVGKTSNEGRNRRGRERRRVDWTRKIQLPSDLSFLVPGA